jgi:hypothetical protein
LDKENSSYFSYFYLFCNKISLVIHLRRKEGMNRIKVLIFAAAIVALTLACSLTGNADLDLSAEDAALVETGVAVVQTEQAAVGELDTQGEAATFTENASADQVQPQATDTPQPEVQAQPTSTPQPTNTQPPSPTPIPEVWDGTWSSHCFYGPGCSDVILEQTGEYVTGTYRDGEGEIEGTAVGNHLVGVWKAAGEIGTIDFWLNDAGTRWSGNYNGSYFWCGAQEGILFPRPCGVATYYGVWQMPCIGDDCEMVVVQDGTEISGTYPNGGSLEGTVTGNHFQGSYQREGYSGSLDFWMSPGGKSWHGNADATQAWCGFRDIENGLVECGVNSWYGNWISQCGSSNCGEIVISQDGKSITGTYADGDGSISGTISGDSLTGTWTRGATSGDFHFYLSDDGTQFQGNYNDNFPWCGYLEGNDPPVVCYQP